VLQIHSFLYPAAATESVSLYAQACLPYIDGDKAYFNCAADENVSIDLKDAGTGVQSGSWSKKVSLGSSMLTVSLKVQKMSLQGGDVITTVEGEIDQGDGVQLVSSDSNLSPDLSVSLRSLIAYGEKKGLPHFFFGTPLSFNAKANAAKMESVLRSR
jgi:hypothetical protein